MKTVQTSSVPFFAGFPGYAYDPEEPIEMEFESLAATMGWKRGGKTYRRRKVQCYVSVFSGLFDEDDGKLANWQVLCKTVRAKGCTDSITQCKKTLQGTHVNLVDMMNALRGGTKVKKFSCYKELARYTEGNPDKIFPKEAAKDNGFLKALLRGVF